MSKQASLNGFVVSSRPGSPAPKRFDIQQPENPNLRVIIVKLEPATHGCCCLCHNKTVLPYCLEYLNDEGKIILWGDVCKECADKNTTERREVE